MSTYGNIFQIRVCDNRHLKRLSSSDLLCIDVFHLSLDEEHNRCDAEQVEWDEWNHIYTSYTEGSVVWARLPGFP